MGLKSNTHFSYTYTVLASITSAFLSRTGTSTARATLGRLLCAMALVVSWYATAAAIGPDDPAAAYYERCVLPPREARAPEEGCDALINDALMGVIVGQFDQEHPTFCYPQKLIDQVQISNFAHQMRTAVAKYMREHPERMSEKTLQVIFAALLQRFPCPD
jgi:hypothetical protein